MERLGDMSLTKHGNMNEEKYSHLPFDKGGLNLVQYRPEKWEEKDDN